MAQYDQPDHTPWYQPRTAEIIQRGGEGFANSIGRGLENFAQGIATGLEKRKEENKRISDLGKSSLAALKASPELLKLTGKSLEEIQATMSPRDIASLVTGTIHGQGVQAGIEQERARMKQFAEERTANSDFASQLTDWQGAQRNDAGKVSQINAQAETMRRLAGIIPGAEGIAASMAAVQPPGRPFMPTGQAALSRAAQPFMEQFAKRDIGSPVYIPPGARVTGGTVGPNGVSQTFTTEPNRQGEQPQRIFLKDGTPTQKAIYGDGTVIDLPADKSKALTDAQANALQFSERMAFNNNVLSALEHDGFDATSAGAAAQKWTPNFMTGEKFQQYDAARKNWIAAVLRKESGAAISKSEEKGALEQYFPAFGDAPSVVKQKAELRALAETNMRRAIGGIENKAGESAGTKTEKRFDTEAAARSAGAKAGDVIELYDPGTATYRKARLK